LRILAWREVPHDDLVPAVGCAAWMGKHLRRRIFPSDLR
jgi:hypothetical protein